MDSSDSVAAQAHRRAVGYGLLTGPRRAAQSNTHTTAVRAAMMRSLSFPASGNRTYSRTRSIAAKLESEPAAFVEWVGGVDSGHG